VRQALGDDPEQPKFVQTVQRKGYRFIAECSRWKQQNLAQRELKENRVRNNPEKGAVATCERGMEKRTKASARRGSRNGRRLKQAWIAGGRSGLAGLADDQFVVPKLKRAERRR